MATETPMMQATALRAGVLFSHTPRARGLESKTYPTAREEDRQILDYLHQNGAQTARYVVGINRMGINPHSLVRDPRQPFIDSETLLSTRKLGRLPWSADMHVIGGVTGPYVAGEKDWHGMLLVTRGKRPLATFADLTTREMHQFHAHIATALQFMHQEHPESTNFVGFSFSPYEGKRQIEIDHPELGRQTILHPRSPVQNLASIHAHMISMDETRLHPTPTSSLESFDPRLVREPFLEQLTELFHELVFTPTQAEFPGLSLGYSQEVSQNDQYPKGSFVTMPLRDFQTYDAAYFVRRVQQRYEDMYWTIAQTVVNTDELKRGRVVMHSPQESRAAMKKLLQTPQFTGLSPNTKRFLRLFAELQDPKDLIHPNMQPKERATIMENFSLLGPAYNQLYFQQGDTMVLCWHPRWITGASAFETVGVFKDQIPTKTQDFQPILERHKETGRRLATIL